jgi:hypothetical protein
MNSFSPTAHGFRIAFRRPSIPLAEIAWRWSLAAAALMLIWLFFREYFASLAVTRVDRLLLASNQPILISRALHRIFSGSTFRFTEAGILIALALVIAWIALASLGRAVTVNAIVDELDFEPATQRASFISLVYLNFLRASVALGAIAGGIGAIFISSSFWSSTHISVESASRIFCLMLFATWLAWCMLNRFLSLSAIVVVGENLPALSSMAESLALFQRRPGAMIVTGILFALIHLGAFLTATSAAFVALSSLSAASPALAWLSQIVVIAAYCAVADFLHTARMAAYVFMMRAPEPAPVLPTPIVPLVALISSSIDPDELILSDVPLPAT